MKIEGRCRIFLDGREVDFEKGENVEIEWKPHSIDDILGIADTDCQITCRLIKPEGVKDLIDFDAISQEKRFEKDWIPEEVLQQINLQCLDRLSEPYSVQKNGEITCNGKIVGIVNHYSLETNGVNNPRLKPWAWKEKD
jgi:hypothetical protein